MNIKNRNPNRLDTNKSHYIKNYTKLFAISKNNVVEVYFDRFEIKNGKEIIYVRPEGEYNTKFYFFPDTTLLFPNKDDAISSVSRKTRSVATSSVSSAVVNAFEKMPKAIKPLKNKNAELPIEISYHGTVDNELKRNIEAASAEIENGKDYLAYIDYDFREKLRSAREDKIPLSDSEYISRDIKQNSTKQNIDKATNKKIHTENVRKEPYFARIDCGKNSFNLHTAYIGNSDIPGYVVDWRRSEIGNAYYNTSLFMNKDDIHIALKRIFTIKNGVFYDFRDDLNSYTNDISDAEINYSEFSDERLTELLKESRADKTTHDIIKTIQSEQYAIITSHFQQNALVNGCAGSGKTMIMYHRLSYMAYNYETVLMKKFKPEHVYIISPSVFFDSSNIELMDKLSISEIKQAQYNTHVDNLINEYCMQNGINNFYGLASLLDNKISADVSFFDEKTFKNYFDEVKNFYKNTNVTYKKAYIDWAFELANKILESYGFEQIVDLKSIKNVSDIHSILSSTKYFLNDCFLKPSSTDEYKFYYSPLAVTTISYDNVREGLKEYRYNSNSYKQRKGRIQRNYELLRASLSVKTKMDAKGDIATNINEFWQLCDNSKAFTKMLALITVQKILNCIVFQDTNNNDFVLKSMFVYNKHFMGNCWGNYNLYLLASLEYTFAKAMKEDSLIFIDEFQNFSAFELACIKDAFVSPVFNLFGDYDQCIDVKGKDLRSNVNLLFSPNTYNLNINYRNAKQITEYINAETNKNMAPIGVTGEVHTKTLDNCNFNIHDRTAIICKNVTVASAILKKYISASLLNNAASSKNILNDKFSVLSVEDCKGLEFDKVYVLDYGMTDNEKYVAYTRALDRLIVIHDNLDVLKSKIKKEVEKENKTETVTTNLANTISADDIEKQHDKIIFDNEILRLIDVLKKYRKSKFYSERNNKVVNKGVYVNKMQSSINTETHDENSSTENKYVRKDKDDIVLNASKIAEKEKLLDEEIKKIIKARSIWENPKKTLV